MMPSASHDKPASTDVSASNGPPKRAAEVPWVAIADELNPANRPYPAFVAIRRKRVADEQGDADR